MQKFEKLKYTTNISEIVLNYIKDVDKNQWFRTHGFDILKLPRNLFLSDATCVKIFENFDCRPMVLKMSPNTFYRLHVDHQRGAAINLFLSGEDSRTFFGDATSESEIFNVQYLNYEKNSFYLLNVQYEHAVLNGNNDRYMLSMGFFEPYTYEQVLNYCIEHSLL
jgi:hypothetical protein